MLISALLVAAAQAAASTPHEHEMGPPPAVVHGSDTCVVMKLSDGLPVIPATIAGRPVNLGFDTGAPGPPHLDEPIIEAQKFAKIGEALMTDPSHKNAVRIGLYDLSDLKVGNIAIDKWVVTGSPPEHSTRRLAKPDGIIGLDAFKGYIVTFDYPAGRVMFTKGRLPDADGRTSFRYEGAIPRVPLSIDGRPIEAHIDTGNARYALILPESYASQLPGYANRFPVGVAHTANNKYDLVALPVRDARVGDMPLYAGTAAFPAPATIGNVGSQVLQDMILKVDPANSIVSLERAKPGLESGCPKP